jgi:hypothetical protein
MSDDRARVPHQVAERFDNLDLVSRRAQLAHQQMRCKMPCATTLEDCAHIRVERVVEEIARPALAAERIIAGRAAC